MDVLFHPQCLVIDPEVVLDDQKAVHTESHVVQQRRVSQKLNEEAVGCTSYSIPGCTPNSILGRYRCRSPQFDDIQTTTRDCYTKIQPIVDPFLVGEKIVHRLVESATGRKNRRRRLVPGRRCYRDAPACQQGNCGTDSRNDCQRDLLAFVELERHAFWILVAVHGDAVMQWWGDVVMRWWGVTS